MVRSHIIALGCAITLFTALGTAVGQPAKETSAQTHEQSSTPRNLQTAFFAESNASALYTQYAKKADKEGYGKLASIFRAIARGEAVHAANCAALIIRMGSTPAVIDEPLIVLSTPENLNAAHATQLYEKDVMYPDYIQKARLENHSDAEVIFVHNMAAEPVHGVLLQQAMDDIEGAKGPNRAFFVCPNCGYVFSKADASVCPVCSTPKDKFEEIK
jgi:rubrerythrin